MQNGHLVSATFEMSIIVLLSSELIVRNCTAHFRLVWPSYVPLTSYDTFPVAALAAGLPVL